MWILCIREFVVKIQGISTMLMFRLQHAVWLCFSGGGGRRNLYIWIGWACANIISEVFMFYPGISLFWFGRRQTTLNYQLALKKVWGNNTFLSEKVSWPFEPSDGPYQKSRNVFPPPRPAPGILLYAVTFPCRTLNFSVAWMLPHCWSLIRNLKTPFYHLSWLNYRL